MAKTKTDFELTVSGDRIAIIDRMVRTLNAHHLTTQAGFYSSGGGVGGLNRFFKARRTGEQLEVFDFDKWYPVPLGKEVFHTHNGENIQLPLYPHDDSDVAARESQARQDKLSENVEAARRVLKGQAEGTKMIVCETRISGESQTSWGFNFAKAEIGEVFYRQEYGEVSVVRAVVSLSAVVLEQTRTEIPDFPPKRSGFVRLEEADDLPVAGEKSNKVR
jgi:hypothetical protein